MALTKYQRILGAFVIIAVFLILIFLAVVAKDNNDVEKVEGWQTASAGKVEFQYPKDFSTKYIHPMDWPPQLQILSEPFACTSGGDAMERAGVTSLRRINSKEYCVTEVVEGAAGSTYTQYAYMFPYKSGSAVLTFTSRAPQCGNYPEPEMSECSAERGFFNPDSLADRIISTFH